MPRSKKRQQSPTSKTKGCSLSTASFGNQVCNDDTVTRTGPHSFEVRGWVDAQNSFGATLRNRFHVKLHCDDSGDRWELDEPVMLVEP